MNQDSEKPHLENRLETIGLALRACPALKDQIMVQIRESVRETAVPPAFVENQPAVRCAAIGSRRQIVGGSIAAFIAVTVISFFALAPAPKVGWAQVAKKLQEQKWIRGRTTIRGKPS